MCYLVKRSSNPNQQIFTKTICSQIKNIGVFRVTELNILGRVGTHIFFWKKNIILCILKGILPFKMHKIVYFSRKPEKILGFTNIFNVGRVRLPLTQIFFIWPNKKRQYLFPTRVINNKIELFD